MPNTHRQDYINVHGTEVYGVKVDPQTRCKHYHSTVDVIAIKFPCCDTYYPCYECHQEVTHHPAVRWSKDHIHEKAILCGVCGHQLTIAEYMNSKFICPICSAAFNEGCQNHYHLYFDL